MALSPYMLFLESKKAEVSRDVLRLGELRRNTGLRVPQDPRMVTLCELIRSKLMKLKILDVDPRHKPLYSRAIDIITDFPIIEKLRSDSLV